MSKELEHVNFGTLNTQPLIDDLEQKLAKATAKILDPSGIELTPGNVNECLGNGEHVDANGAPIECCCDECDYFSLCWREKEPEEVFEEIDRKLKEAERIIHERQNNV